MYAVCTVLQHYLPLMAAHGTEFILIRTLMTDAGENSNNAEANVREEGRGGGLVALVPPATYQFTYFCWKYVHNVWHCVQYSTTAMEYLLRVQLA